MVSIEKQIKCVKRELAMRQRVYPRLVAKGKMSEDDKENELRAMQYVLWSLEALREGNCAACDGDRESPWHTGD